MPKIRLYKFCCNLWNRIFYLNYYAINPALLIIVVIRQYDFSYLNSNVYLR